MKRRFLLAGLLFLACNRGDDDFAVSPIGGYEGLWSNRRVAVMGSRVWRVADGFYDLDVYCRDRGRILRFRHSEASGELRVWCEPIPDERKAGW